MQLLLQNQKQRHCLGNAGMDHFPRSFLTPE
uniref:Uncharacterized protein n=1 Tax=Rhizophora mucronata TaxID=61149 RepID=A0A2P2PU81_RHIMU